MLKLRKRTLRRLPAPRWINNLQTWLSRRVHSMTRWQRIGCAVTAAVVLLSVITPVTLTIIQNQRYKLSADIQKLIGTPNKNLSAKITYNAGKDSWQFNQTSIPIGSSGQEASMPSVEALKAQIGGSGKKDESLYAVDMPSTASKGVTYYDTNTNLSFSLVPQFSAGEGRKSDDRIVYPAAGGAKLVYTAKANGMKEDIVLTKPMGDEVEFSYKLNLPDTLEAKIQADGSLGVFSPDPVLFGNISYGGGQDKEKILSAQKTAAKDHLLFVLPAPVIVEAGGNASKAPARFSLEGSVLSVKASGLADLHYPLSIDPSVVVTSSSDFATGTGDNISYDTDQISRGKVTGGAISGGWTTTSSGSFLGRYALGSAVYNGYLYGVGGYTSNPRNEVSYAPINSDGTVGAWSTTTPMPAGRTYPATVAYNNRLYVYGGYNSGTAALDSVIYATINSDGTLGSWTNASNNMATGVCRFGWTEYNGYLYAAGGAYGTVASNCANTSLNLLNTVQYAPILANGDVGAWTTSGSAFTSARKDPGFAIYNGYAYLSNGTYDGNSTHYRDTQYAKVGSNGDIGSWTTSAQQPSTPAYRFAFRAYNGYLYMSGGTNNLAGTLYAPILANGDIGPWRSSTSQMSPGRWSQGFVLYNGYAYYFGGNDANAGLSDTGYAKIDPAGTTASFATVASNFTTARALACSVAYNGYLYVIGGSTTDSGSNNNATTYYTTINSTTGNVGSWAATTSLPAGRGSAGCVAYGGYVYVIGGYTGSDSMLSSVVYAPLNSNGTIGTWVTTAPSLPNAKAKMGVFTYTTSSGTYLYAVGGYNTNGNARKSYYSLLSSSGVPGAWSTASTDLSTEYTYQAFAQVGKYIYALGGKTDAPSTMYDTVEYTAIQSNGDLGAWSTTTSMNTAIGFSNGTTVNGCIYAVGGENSGATSLANVQYACPAADGTISAWYNAPNLTVGTTDTAVTSYNGYIYGVGGYTTAVTNTTQFAAVNNGGSGSLATWAQKSSGLGSSLYGHGFSYNNGYFYIVGGDTSGGGTAATSNTYYAPLNNDSTIGTWTAATSLNTARHSHMTYISGGYIYAVGGANSAGTLLTSVEYAPINSNGTLGNWVTATGSLPTGHKQAAAATYNGYLYSLGGNNGSPSSTVYYANSASGDVPSWSTTTSLPVAVRNGSAAVYNGYLYVVGGIDGSGPTGRTVYAPINGDGTLGAWQYTSPVPLGGATAAIAANGTLYAASIDGASCSGATFRATIYADGSLSPFQQTNGSGSCGQANGSGVYVNGVLYVPLSGGASDGSRSDTIPRIGRYAKLLDLGGGYSLTGLSFGGSLANGGIANLGFRSASADGILGTKQSASSLTGTAISCSDANTRYVQALATLDDTYTSVYPDTNSSPSTLTDFTLSYSTSRAPTALRLMHGKYFSGEVAQGLDVCGNS